MNFLRSLLILALFALASCAHQAEHFVAPSATRLEQQSSRLASAVTASKESVHASSVATTRADKAHQAEAARLLQIEPKIGDLLRVAPPELKPAVTYLQLEVTNLKSEQAVTAQALAEAVRAQADATARLEEANAAKNEVQRFQQEYTAAVDALTLRAQKSEDGWAKDSKSLLWYRLHWFAGWVIMLLGIAGAVLFWVFRGSAKIAGLFARF